ncbi:MAG: winged helix-turn-helix domain-containing protein [Methanosarcinales archaeon]
MTEIFEKPVPIKNIMVASTDKAKAVEDTIRAMILDILSEKSRSIIEIVEELKKRGIDKAPTTIRHHVDILKKAGLVELSKIEEVRGGVLKYYASNTRMLGYEEPKDFEEMFEKTILENSEKILKIIKEIMVENGNKIKEVAESLKDCPYCSTPHFMEYVIVKILHRSIVEALQKKEFMELLQI